MADDFAPPIGPDGRPLIGFGPDSNCTLDLCSVDMSILRYLPSVPASAAMLAFFSLSLLAHVVQGVRRRTWGFMVCMVCGCALEIAGYVGRVILHGNPFSFIGFMVQIIFITIAPVFFCAGVYVLLAQVCNLIDPSKSRIPPSLYYWIFIPCDIISLILQAVGGALSTVSTTLADVQRGANISLAGLVFQVAALLAFSTLFADYVVVTWRDPATRPAIAGSRRMRVFLGFLFLAIGLILLRCVYRIVELHDGYFSHWFRDEPLFIALESAVMVAAVIALNIGHPGLVFGRKAGVEKINGISAAGSDGETAMTKESQQPSA